MSGTHKLTRPGVRPLEAGGAGGDLFHYLGAALLHSTTPLWDWIVSQVDTLSIRSEANLQLKGKIEKIGEANLNCLELVKKMIDF